MSTQFTQQNREMAEVLIKIIENKKVWIKNRKETQPLQGFIDQLEPSDRDFYAALTRDTTAFILECKKASPSKGLIRDDFDLPYIASVYGKYASAVSVLTDEKFFQGNFDFIPTIKSQLTQPVLCKDFMIDPYQIYLARHYGANAILLMLSVLNDSEYRELADIAHSLKLGVLTEVSNKEELNRAVNLGAKVIGINNRNLRDLSVDLNRTSELAPLIPKGTIIISESGIYTNQQVRSLRNHVNGFLIGSSLMAEDNIELAVRRVLIGENKVCGLTHPDDAAAVYQVGAVYGGLIFAEGSKRKVSVEQARITMSGAPLNYVGVFQNQTIDTILDTVSQLGLSAVQLHGNEDQPFVNQLRSRLPETCDIWKAYGVDQTVPELLQQNINRHLLDSKVGTQSGGTGKQFDWSLISSTQNIMLAGGLSPSNVKHATQLGCLGLDLNSGVESAPGKKDANLLHNAFEQIKHY